MYNQKQPVLYNKRSREHQYCRIDREEINHTSVPTIFYVGLMVAVNLMERVGEAPTRVGWLSNVIIQPPLNLQ